MAESYATSEEKTVSVRRVEKRSRLSLLGYDLFQLFCRITFIPLFGIRCLDRENFPASGGGLVCSNHQSNLDPVLLGIIPNRRMNYLARRTLYKTKWLAPFIDFLDAIPLDRDGMGIAGIKETLRRLKRDELVSMYPEGTRTEDGRIAKFKPGFITLARRAKKPLIPVAISGAFDAWPRGQLMFQPGRIVLCCQKPILPEEFEHMTDDELIAELERRIRGCFERAEKQRRRSMAA